MIRSVIVRQPALDDITEAVAWYEAQSSGLGEKLLEQIVHALERAQNNPELFRIVRRNGGSSPHINRSFSVQNLFSAVDDTIYVHAVLHGARHDRHWRGRF